MKNRWSLLSVISGTLLLSGCFDPPELSVVPHIEFNSLRYLDYPTGADSMLLKFDFEDGDGDIGLNDFFLTYPYHLFDLVIDSRDSVVTYADSNVVPPLYLQTPVNKVLLDSADIRPKFNLCDYYYGDCPNLYSDYCNNFDDTLFIQSNEYYQNFHMEFLRKVNGQYQVINFAEAFESEQCINFNARIPIFSNDAGNTLTGTYTYRLYSQGFQVILRADTFKVRFYLYDRLLHKSNVVESPDLTLPGITIERD